ncbi:MAG: hypothetical protein KAI81_07330, partial [Candidatus Marinimicrobia bacterium]|nr:hypothetical protein [Candidatus Neomarinimicrobiota bacterium]
MTPGLQIPIKNSIATKILAVVLSFYLLIAIVATLSQVWTEYRYQKANIIQDLNDIESSFKNGLAVSMWGLDQEALEASIDGMMSLPTLVGAVVNTDAGLMVAIGGVVPTHGITADVGLHVNLSGISDEDATTHETKPYNFEIFEHKFPITYDIKGKSIHLGQAIIYSSSSVIYRRMKLQVPMLIISILLTLITFSLALLWAINHYLRRPLASLAADTQNVNLENLNSFKVKVKTSGRNELKVLEESFNLMIGNLYESMIEGKQTEKALKVSESNLHALINNKSESIWSLDKNYNLIICNDYFRDSYLAAYNVELKPGINLVTILSPDLKAFWKPKYDEALAGNSVSFEFNTTIQEKDHSFENFLSPIFSEGEVTGVSALSVDITDRRQAEEKSDQLEKKMQHAQKLESLGVLAGGIAHDFNNILTGILGNAEFARLALSPENPIIKNIKNIENGAIHAADLSKQMLAYSGKGHFVVESINLNVMIDEMMHLLKTFISKKAILNLNLADSIPNVEADVTQIRQVFMNLITNASEAIGDRSGIIAISSGVMEVDDNYFDATVIDNDLKPGYYSYFEVSDTGVGMDKETQAKIFDPFYTTKFTGRGLGLAAVLGIIMGHKGSIKIYSEVNKGTTFKVLFPCDPEMSKPNQDKDKDKEGRSPYGLRPDGKGKSILVVDDEEHVRSLAKMVLEDKGFT